MKKKFTLNMNEDRKFLEDPIQWPHWPFCPLKDNSNQHGIRKLAILRTRGDGKYDIVMDQNLFDIAALRNAKFEPITLDEVLKNWMVD